MRGRCVLFGSIRLTLHSDRCSYVHMHRARSHTCTRHTCGRQGCNIKGNKIERGMKVAVSTCRREEWNGLKEKGRAGEGGRACWVYLRTGFHYLVCRSITNPFITSSAHFLLRKHRYLRSEESTSCPRFNTNTRFCRWTNNEGCFHFLLRPCGSWKLLIFQLKWKENRAQVVSVPVQPEFVPASNRSWDKHMSHISSVFAAAGL